MKSGYYSNFEELIAIMRKEYDSGARFFQSYANLELTKDKDWLQKFEKHKLNLKNDLKE